MFQALVYISLFSAIKNKFSSYPLINLSFSVLSCYHKLSKAIQLANNCFLTLPVSSRFGKQLIASALVGHVLVSSFVLPLTTAGLPLLSIVSPRVQTCLSMTTSCNALFKAMCLIMTHIARFQPHLLY